jgi:biotin carboxylase
VLPDGSILILGAGLFQVPLIRNAKRLGLTTHVVSRAGDYPGIEMADFFHQIDTTDIPAVIELAKHLKVDAAITSGTDVCIPTLGALCDEIGLAGPSRQVAETVSRKDAFRAFAKMSGMRHPRFAVVREVGELPCALTNLTLPVLFKPVDSSGSRGVNLLATTDPDQATSAFYFARSQSPAGAVCVEEMLPGIEVGGNAMLYEGRLVFLAISAKHMNAFLVRGHSYPTNITSSQQHLVQRELEECCRGLGYSHGPLNFDVMVTDDSATIIEVGARLGGNGLSNLIEYAYGYDIELDILRLALGQGPAPPTDAIVRPCGSWVFGSTRAGRLISVARLADVRRVCPCVWDLVCHAKPGQHVEPMVHNANLLGYILFTVNSSSDYHTISDHLQRQPLIEVD